MILTLGDDGRAVHVQVRKAAAPAVNRIGVIEPIRATRHFADDVQYKRQIHQGEKGIVAFHNVREVERVRCLLQTQGQG